MMKGKTRASIGIKLYIFIIITVLGVAIGTALLAHRTTADQIDRYYKQVASDTAKNFSSFVDGDYLAELKTLAESEEFQELRAIAEERDDESIIQECLEEHGLWEGYVRTRADLVKYLRNMQAIKYLYIVACGDETAKYDLCLMDDDDNPIYITGYYEEREPEFEGVDLTKTIEPTISTSDWGWLCSAYAPVHDSKGNLVCHIGCDFGMNEVMAERRRALLYIILAAAVLTALVLVGAVFYVNRIVIKPLDSLTSEMKKFRPMLTTNYQEAGVASLALRSNDEISELYEGIRSMQINIIDYLNDLDALQKDKERAEEDIKSRDEQIGQISKEAYRDTLTGVGSKAAYAKEVEEINQRMAEGEMDLALVMVDMNDLKEINDKHGHKNGDLYIQGCCHLICEVFKHSPVFRIGGDEFVAILEGSDFDNRFELVKKLRGDYEAAMGDTTRDPWSQYSAAVGMAEVATDDRTIDLVFKRADKAMYMEKRKMKEVRGSYR